ncbi:MAG TPA: hypothetical protein VGP63_20340 [Planctomycetaceae bacterium]|jgi:hypothetical protein|nr:hypothetical protein [Planctomycetaceae bacterium]
MTRGQFWAFAILFIVGGLLFGAQPDRAAAWSSTPAPTRGMGASAPNPVEPIVKQMKAAQTRLKEGNTGSETRGIQQQVVRDLDKLIEAASRQSGSPNQGSGKPQSGEKSGGEKSPQNAEGGSPPPSQAAQRDGGAGASAKAGGSAPGKQGGTRTRKAIQTKVALPGDRSLVREVWGHLPPAMQEHVRVDFSETVLPAYDELVRRYFEALLEESPQRSGTSPAGNAPRPLNK